MPEVKEFLIQDLHKLYFCYDDDIGRYFKINILKPDDFSLLRKIFDEDFVAKLEKLKSDQDEHFVDESGKLTDNANEGSMAEASTMIATMLAILGSFSGPKYQDFSKIFWCIRYT